MVATGMKHKPIIKLPNHWLPVPTGKTIQPSKVRLGMTFYKTIHPVLMHYLAVIVILTLHSNILAAIACGGVQQRQAQQMPITDIYMFSESKL